jgi:hypothetical protein
MIVYGAASFAHFSHNAVYISAYPNLPAWLTPVGVYVSWLVIAGIGAFGYWLYRRGSRVVGLAVIGIYALLGFGGLDHYAMAPLSAHSMAMNATILGEVIAGSVLLIVIVRVGISSRSTCAAHARASAALHKGRPARNHLGPTEDALKWP